MTKKPTTIKVLSVTVSDYDLERLRTKALPLEGYLPDDVVERIVNALTVNKERPNCRPGDLFEATEETKLTHSTEVGARVLVLSCETDPDPEQGKLWKCCILWGNGSKGRYRGIRDHAAGYYDKTLLTRFKYVGNIYDAFREGVLR